jgi:hypothetical protein
VLAGTGAALTVAACGDEPRAPTISATELSQAICETTVRCECAPILANAGFVAPLTCGGWNITDLFGMPDSAGEYGGEYGDAGEFGSEFGDIGGDDNGDDDTAGGDVTINFDQDCVDRIAAALSSASCDLAVPLMSCGDYCKIYYGTRFEFQPCSDETQCAQGLVCSNFECRDPCTVQTVGEGESCESATCAPGLECVSGDDIPPTCLPTDDGGGLGVGAPCMGHSECASGSCPAGFCADLPGAGEPCSDSGTCRDDLTCLPSDAFPDDGVCTAVSPMCNAVLFLAVGLE